MGGRCLASWLLRNRVGELIFFSILCLRLVLRWPVVGGVYLGGAELLLVRLPDPPPSIPPSRILQPFCPKPWSLLVSYLSARFRPSSAHKSPGRVCLVAHSASAFPTLPRQTGPPRGCDLLRPRKSRRRNARPSGSSDSLQTSLEPIDRRESSRVETARPIRPVCPALPNTTLRLDCRLKR
jgi:hypothetical protein